MSNLMYSYAPKSKDGKGELFKSLC